MGGAWQRRIGVAAQGVGVGVTGNDRLLADRQNISGPGGVEMRDDAPVLAGRMR